MSKTKKKKRSSSSNATSDHIMQPQQPTKSEIRQGYLHNVTPIKKAKFSNTKYFNATFETEQELCPVVCFSPQKHAELKIAQQIISPLKLSGIDISVGRSGKSEIKVFRNSSVSIIPQ